MHDRRLGRRGRKGEQVRREVVGASAGCHLARGRRRRVARLDIYNGSGGFQFTSYMRKVSRHWVIRGEDRNG